MKPQELIEGLKSLANQCPLEAVCFRVPSAPSCTNHHMRIDVSPKDITDMLEYIQDLEFNRSYTSTEMAHNED